VIVPSVIRLPLRDRTCMGLPHIFCVI